VNQKGGVIILEFHRPNKGGGENQGIVRERKGAKQIYISVSS